ncbi:glycoside hydrolase family protein [Rhodopirellula sallentina SM41]|uniref:Glycoside hydrolase family protein n=2 Tax=Rhodopirellula TaxID=265488 RepID=M5U471_9BACT|nr:glycoside hydrolase family protein [Rhodopirellula sallentina SM41]
MLSDLGGLTFWRMRLQKPAKGIFAKIRDGVCSKLPPVHRVVPPKDIAMTYRFDSYRTPAVIRRAMALVFVCHFVLLEMVASGQSLPEPTWERLPRWRGFNLLEKFHLQWSNGPYVESDFEMISDFGFNFVRLPMDYRVWCRGGDWNRFDEDVLREIDDAVRWGQKYSVHVCLNFHRAPGFTVASPAEKTSLWVDQETQRVCAKHWSEFAKRYKGVPNRNLSFNLFNEPGDVDEETYVAVVAKMAKAIREQDPERLIICDGLEWGQKPVPGMRALRVAQATRGYAPIEITHYRASWMRGAAQFPLPMWPRVVADATLYSPTKIDVPREARTPLRIRSEWQDDTPLRIRVASVSSRSRLVVRADGKTVFEKTFVPGPGKGEWRSVEYFPQWQSYRAVYNRDYETTIPSGTRELEIFNAEGDWVSLAEIGIGHRDSQGRSKETVLPFRNRWAAPPAVLTYHTDRGDAPAGRISHAYFSGAEQENRQWLWDVGVAPWIEGASRTGVVVGEFGCHHRTPHDVTLAWMEDNLANWQRAGIGWALWNFRGSFGVLDSKRTDVKYERYRGHKLDRKMLDLLQRY